MANLFELLFSKDFEEKFNQELDKVLSERDGSIEEAISDIAEHLSAIDALLSDMAAEGADLEQCIFEIESKLNSK